MRYFFLFFAFIFFISCQKKNEKRENFTIEKKQKLQTSDVIVMENNSINHFRDCKAFQNKNVLTLVLTDITYSEFSGKLKILIKDNEYISEYYETVSVCDSNYKQPIFKIIKQHFSLNTLKLNKGDSLKGKFNVEVLASYKWEKSFKDTIKINGSIQTIVE